MIAPRPSTAYVVCTTSRSGSGLLCEALWNTGLAGHPDEYFDPSTRAEYVRSWGVTDSREYLKRARSEATTGNGVLGLKVMWEHLEAFAEEFLPPMAPECPEREPLSAVFGDVRYVFLRRQDKVRQAVSLWRRLESGVFCRYDGEAARPAPTPRFDFELLHDLVRTYAGWEGSWRRYFAHWGIAPLEISYENDLERDLAGTVARVLEHVGVSLPEDVPVRVRRKRQRDHLSEELVRRYEAQLRTGGE